MLVGDIKLYGQQENRIKVYHRPSGRYAVYVNNNFQRNLDSKEEADEYIEDLRAEWCLSYIRPSEGG